MKKILFTVALFWFIAGLSGGLIIAGFSCIDPDIEHTQGDGTYVPAPMRSN